MAKRKSLFDDKPVEIQELTYIIKQDINSLNTQIAQLQEVFIDYRLLNNVYKSGEGLISGFFLGILGMGPGPLKLGILALKIG